MPPSSPRAWVVCVKQKFFVEGAVRAIPFVGTVGVLHRPAFFLGLSNAFQEFLPSLQKLLLELLNAFLFHCSLSPLVVGSYLSIVPEYGRGQTHGKTKRPRLKESWDARLNSPPPSAARLQIYFRALPRGMARTVPCLWIPNLSPHP